MHFGIKNTLKSNRNHTLKQVTKKISSLQRQKNFHYTRHSFETRPDPAGQPGVRIGLG
jgi:hypothetical protein